MMNDSMTKYLEIFLKQHVGKKMRQKKKKITVTWVDISPNIFASQLSGKNRLYHLQNLSKKNQSIML